MIWGAVAAVLVVLVLLPYLLRKPCAALRQGTDKVWSWNPGDPCWQAFFEHGKWILHMGIFDGHNPHDGGVLIRVVRPKVGFSETDVGNLAPTPDEAMGIQIRRMQERVMTLENDLRSARETLQKAQTSKPKG